MDHVLKHIETLKELSRELTDEENTVISLLGVPLYRLFVKKRLSRNSRRRLESFQTKNKKVNNLANDRKIKHSTSLYNVPIVNLSDLELTENEKTVLSFGLDHSFVDKNKNIKSFLAANLEKVAETVDKSISPDEKENFHEFLRSYTHIFTKNVFATKDYTYVFQSETANYQ